MRHRWVGRSTFSTLLLSLHCECNFHDMYLSFLWTCRFCWGWGVDQTLWWRTELLREEIDGFFLRITNRLCVQGKEWVAVFSAAQPLLHTCVYSRNDLRACSHGSRFSGKKYKSSFELRHYVYSTCERRMWVKFSVLPSVQKCVCLCVSMWLCGMQFFFFFFYCDTMVQLFYISVLTICHRCYCSRPLISIRLGRKWFCCSKIWENE